MLKLAPVTPKLPQWRLQFDGWAQQLLIDEKPVLIHQYSFKNTMPPLSATMDLLGVIVGEAELNAFSQAALDQSKELVCDLPEEVLPFFKFVQDQKVTLATFLKWMASIQATPFHLVVDSPWIERFPYALPVLHPEKLLAPSQRISCALLLPSLESADISWEICAQFLEDFKEPLRVIPELDLIYQWDGVEILYYLPSSLSTQGERGIKGFEATGGSVVCLEKVEAVTH